MGSGRGGNTRFVPAVYHGPERRVILWFSGIGLPGTGANRLLTAAFRLAK